MLRFPFRFRGIRLQAANKRNPTMNETVVKWWPTFGGSQQQTSGWLQEAEKGLEAMHQWWLSYGAFFSLGGFQVWKIGEKNFSCFFICGRNIDLTEWNGSHSIPYLEGLYSFPLFPVTPTSESWPVKFFLRGEERRPSLTSLVFYVVFGITPQQIIKYRPPSFVKK